MSGETALLNFIEFPQTKQSFNFVTLLSFSEMYTEKLVAIMLLKFQTNKHFYKQFLRNFYCYALKSAFVIYFNRQVNVVCMSC